MLPLLQDSLWWFRKPAERRSETWIAREGKTKPLIRNDPGVCWLFAKDLWAWNIRRKDMGELCIIK